MTISATTLDDLLRAVLDRLIRKGHRVQASRGGNRELVGVTLKLTNPRARLSHAERKGTVFSGLGELIWYLAGSDNARFIAYYIDQYAKDAEGDGTIHGAYGPRLLKQIGRVTRLLREKPQTRRAVVQLFSAADLAREYKDIPCTCALQFFVRSRQLDMVAMMRSNDAYLGFPHDVFTFTMIQEIVARELGYEPGGYTHFASSLHLYDQHIEKAKGYLEEGWQATENVGMPPMPVGNPWPSIRTLIRAEARIRNGRLPSRDVGRLDSYWQDLVRLLQIYGCHKKREHGKIPSIRRGMVHRIYDEYVKKKQAPALTAPASGQRELFSDDRLE